MLAVLRSIRNGSTYEAAYRAAGVSHTTVWRWRKHWPRYAALLQKTWDDNVKVVEDAHYASAIRGNVIAQMHILHNRAHDRWKKAPETVINNSLNNNVIDAEVTQIVEVFVDSPESVHQIAKNMNHVESSHNLPEPLPADSAPETTV